MTQKQRGSIIIMEVVVIFIFSLVMLAVLGNAVSEFRTTRGSVNREQAFAIADAGINYYQWHLAQFPVDYQDGTGAAPTSHAPFPNPCYLHTYTDTDLETILGYYCLEITAPLTGSTIVTVKSTGYVLLNSKIQRSITAR